MDNDSNIDRLLTTFQIESNRIEGISGAREIEVVALRAFISGAAPTVKSLSALALVYTPEALLRRARSMNVRVGSHTPPRGGPEIVHALDTMLSAIEIMDPYKFHLAYEDLHPFMDGNGRTGRALWAWKMVRRYPDGSKLNPVSIFALNWNALLLGFLHSFYYQTLGAARK